MMLTNMVPHITGVGSAAKIMKNKLQFRGGFLAEMNRREAGLILNVKPNASSDEIRNRHRKLMITNHPDNSNFFFFFI
jgi:hypothetical protein